MDSEITIMNVIGAQNELQIKFLLEQLISIGIKILNAQEGSLLLADEKKSILTFVMQVGKEQKLVGKTVPIGEGITGMAALTRDVQSASAVTGGNFFYVKDAGMPTSVLAAPMLADDELIGVITAVSFDKKHTFSVEDCSTYGMFANIAAALVKQQQTLNLLSSPQTEIASESTKIEYNLTKSFLELIRTKPQIISVMEQIINGFKNI